ncbi:PHP domain-containing protein [Kushneria sinocarnis]|nr:PHP domain-containing protein [Kushneria sinocarnis]
MPPTAASNSAGAQSATGDASGSLPARFHDATGIDLHLHSTASDGRLSPDALLHLCHRRGLHTVAVTDHDTVAGLAEAQQTARSLDMTLLPGAELSCRWRGIGIHVVALLPAAPGAVLADGLAQLSEARHQRAVEIARRLERAGLAQAFERAREEAGSDRPLGRPDFARALVTAGLVPDLPAAFKRYLGAGRPGDVKTHWPELAVVVDWIVRDGGVAVLAHPLRYRLTRRKLTQLLDDFTAAGGEGAELVSGYQNEQRTYDLAGLLERRGLYASLGSDFHYEGGALAPGTLGPLPTGNVVPIWQHPRLSGHATRSAPASLPTTGSVS